MIQNFRHKGLQRYWTRSGASGLRPDWVKKIGILLDALEAAQSPEDMAMTGAGFHALKGDLKGFYSIRINKQWRICFRWQDGHAWDVEISDYH